MKNYLLPLFILFITTIACEQDSIDITDSFKSENGLTYNESLDNWNNLKSVHGNSYSYQVPNYSWTGNSSTTTITVQNGIVIAREYESLKPNEPGLQPEFIESITYQENKSELGTHEFGADIKTIDDYYNDCSTKYLTVDQETNMLTLSTDQTGMITSCGYTPENCADDCYRGITIKNFEWTKQ
ncbi:hypothetical protein [Flavicella marina]|uniref:hypothetical protein n=1 Tax=Flavicella marina TaxID=1475951 RepID=UPI001264B7A5|nr:hypothetical protein [Flavicella marina]